MRRYFLSNGVDVPDELQTAWTEVDAVRDELGEKEINYEAAEQAYDKEEREYTEKEGLFVDDLSASDPMPTVPVQPAPPADYLDGLTRFSFGPSDVELVPAMPEDLILPPPPTYLTTPEFASGSPTGTPVFEATRHVTPRKHNSVLRSGDATPTQQTPYTGRVMGADGCSHALVKWSDTRNQIEEWMLQSLKSSPLQIRWLKSLVPQGEMSDEDWWQLVDRYWHSDSLDDPVYHTGETIVSGGTVSQVVSSLRDREMLDTVIENNFTAEPSNTAPLLPGDQLVDALELVSFPTRIKPRDLVDVPRRVTFELESQSKRSASTELSHASHSSGPECSTIIVRATHLETPTPSGMDNLVAEIQQTPEDVGITLGKPTVPALSSGLTHRTHAPRLGMALQTPKMGRYAQGVLQTMALQNPGIALRILIPRNLKIAILHHRHQRAHTQSRPLSVEPDRSLLEPDSKPDIPLHLLYGSEVPSHGAYHC
jgi:hypothetical protein